MRFTNEQIMTTLREVVAEKPDFVYVAPDDGEGLCRYVHDEEPGCLVGHVLHRLGASLPELREFEGNAANIFGGAFSPDWVSLRAANALVAAQIAQDQGEQWHTALSAAEKEFEK